MNAAPRDWREHDVPVPAEGICTAVFDDEGVLYAVDLQRSLLVTASAIEVWAAIDGRSTAGEIAEQLAAFHGVGRQTVVMDVLRSLSAFETLHVVSRSLSD